MLSMMRWMRTGWYRIFHEMPEDTAFYYCRFDRWNWPIRKWYLNYYRWRCCRDFSWFTHTAECGLPRGVRCVRCASVGLYRELLLPSRIVPPQSGSKLFAGEATHVGTSSRAGCVEYRTIPMCYRCTDWGVWCRLSQRVSWTWHITTHPIRILINFPRRQRANFRGLVLLCIDAKFCK